MSEYSPSYTMRFLGGVIGSLKEEIQRLTNHGLIEDADLELSDRDLEELTKATLATMKQATPEELVVSMADYAEMLIRTIRRAYKG